MNPAAIKAACHGDLANMIVASTPGGIERHEVIGQQLLIDTAMLPKQISGATPEQLAKLGFRFGSDIDELFIQCELPRGWTKQSTEHRMNSLLLDDKGWPRADIFYKAAFYDRRADMAMKGRFSVQLFGAGKDDNHRHASIMDCDTIAFDLGEWHFNDNALYNKLKLTAEAWLDKHYSRWEDPLAYWD